MNLNRRNLLKSTLGATIATTFTGCSLAQSRTPDARQLETIANAPVLKLDALKDPVKIASVELLRSGKFHFVRARSTDGAEGISVTNSHVEHLHPIFNRLVAPYFVGKDARDLESLIDEVYVYKSNYKLTSLALWCPVAWVELSILDMLGRVANCHVGEFFGGVVRDKVSMYYASGNRNTTAEQEVEVLRGLIEKAGTRAVKFKVGGRMSNNADSIPGRSEGLIRIVRKALGDDVTIFADSNGSYDAPAAIEIGKLLQDHHINMFEEPCPFDHLEETKRVADALEIPIAGGEQESSQRRFRWMIENSALQIVQPDMHYYGGYIRSTRVARMAAAAGLTVVPHMSGGGVGYVDVLNFCSFTPNIGPFHEYKGGIEETGPWYDPPLQFKDGAINIPKGSGSGINPDPEILAKAKPVK